MIDVRRCSVSDIEAAPNIAALHDEYAEESSLPELGVPIAQVGSYRTLEATGMFYPIGAFDDSKIMGFIAPIVIVLPHYGVLTATVESFFVGREYRPTGVGLMLLKCAEELALELGAKALLLSAPVGSVLAEVMAARKSYRHSNNVFIRALA